MDDETISRFIDDALSSYMLDGALCDKYQIEPDQLDELLLDHSIEKCADCGWWFESCMLFECNDGRWICPHCLQDAIANGEVEEEE